MLVGHGLRARQQMGPLDAAGAPTLVVVRLRRYRCRACGRTATVVPRTLVARRHYSAGAVGLAVALFGVAGLSTATVRRRVSPAGQVGFTAASGWATLRRWVHGARAGSLYAKLPPVIGASARLAAEHMAAMLAANAPPLAATLPLEHQAFLGGAHVA